MTVRFLIANAYAVGGTIRTTFNTASALADRHDVEIVSVFRRRDTPQLTLDPRVRLRSLTDMRPGRQTGWRAWASRRPSRLIHPQDFRYKGFNALSDIDLYRFLRSVEDGVLVSTRPGLNLAVARFGRPSVVRIGQDHLNLGAYKPKLREAIARSYPRLDLVTALTESSADEYRALLGPETRVEAVPNGIGDLDGRRAVLEAPLVVAAGRPSKRKGFDRLLEAWAQVAPAFPEWKLAIFGSPKEDRELLGGLARELDVSGSLRVEGNTPRLHEELAKASVFAMSSRREGLPMVLLEAMGVGLPVVAFDCPTGPREIVTDGENGYLVPDGDVDAFAAALTRLMGDDSLRRTFGSAAVDQAGRFDIAAITARWEALFAELAAQKASSGRPARRSAASTRALPAGVRRTRRAAGRLRRKLAGSAAAEARLAETQAELRRTRRALKTTRGELRAVSAELEHLRTTAGDMVAELPETVEQVIAQAREERLTYLSPSNLRTLAAVMLDIERNQLPGTVIEAGAALGGSAIVIAAAKSPERPMKVYDVFGMIPPPTERDGADVHKRYEKIAGGQAKGVGGDTYYGYHDDLYGEVTESFGRLGVAAADHNVELIQGLFEDTIDLDGPVAFAHLDGDWYESTMTCLTRIVPLLVPGGRIVLDDYYHWSGCRTAVDEYFKDRDGFRMERRAKLHVVRE
jgi:glycosyltransferase involved in cell wall biosynthesis/predicted O-methyltransferase YrrM